jgi:hypothetical protein
MKTTVALVVASLILFNLQSAYAGATDPEHVYVLSYYASGTVGSVRNSADTTQQIGCQTMTQYGSVSVQCTARDASGNWNICFSSDPVYFPLVQSIGPSSYIHWHVDGQANCTELTVDNSSLYAPPQP